MVLAIDAGRLSVVPSGDATLYSERPASVLRFSTEPLAEDAWVTLDDALRVSLANREATTPGDHVTTIVAKLVGGAERVVAAGSFTSRRAAPAASGAQGLQATALEVLEAEHDDPRGLLGPARPVADAAYGAMAEMLANEPLSRVADLALGAACPRSWDTGGTTTMACQTLYGDYGYSTDRTRPCSWPFLAYEVDRGLGEPVHAYDGVRGTGLCDRYTPVNVTLSALDALAPATQDVFEAAPPIFESAVDTSWQATSGPRETAVAAGADALRGVDLRQSDPEDGWSVFTLDATPDEGIEQLAGTFRLAASERLVIEISTRGPADAGYVSTFRSAPDARSTVRVRTVVPSGAAAFAPHEVVEDGIVVGFADAYADYYGLPAVAGQAVSATHLGGRVTVALFDPAGRPVVSPARTDGAGTWLVRVARSGSQPLEDGFYAFRARVETLPVQDDAGTGGDATVRTPIPPGQHVGYLGTLDKSDGYSLQVRAGQRFRILLSGPDDFSLSYEGRGPRPGERELHSFGIGEAVDFEVHPGGSRGEYLLDVWAEPGWSSEAPAGEVLYVWPTLRGGSMATRDGVAYLLEEDGLWSFDGAAVSRRDDVRGGGCLAFGDTGIIYADGEVLRKTDAPDSGPIAYTSRCTVAASGELVINVWPERYFVGADRSWRAAASGLGPIGPDGAAYETADNGGQSWSPVPMRRVDPTTGESSFFAWVPSGPRPLAFAADGAVFFADAGDIRRYAPDGAASLVARIPSARIISMTAAGDDLYVHAQFEERGWSESRIIRVPDVGPGFEGFRVADFTLAPADLAVTELVEEREYLVGGVENEATGKRIIRATVTNVGGSPTPRSTHASLSTTPIDFDNHPLLEIPAGLGPGESLVLDWTVESSRKVGSRTYVVRADYSWRLAEPDEENNEAQLETYHKVDAP